MARIRDWSAEHRRRYKDPHHRFMHYQSKAKKRGLEFEITEEQFLEITKENCTYCNRHTETMGVDRMNNSVGYVFENCVPCCKACNLMKGQYSAQQFIDHCKRVAIAEMTSSLGEECDGNL